MKELLKETYDRVKRHSGYDVRNPQAFKALLSDPTSFGVYAKSLSEGLTPGDKENFIFMAENTRVSLLENSMFQLNPYETLTVPILRNFYPRLIAKELVNVMPIDKPDVIQAFVRATFKRYGDTAYGNEFPSVVDISRGPSVGITVAASADAGTTNILAEAGSGIDNTNAHIEKDFVITGVVDATGGTASVRIIPTVDGVFSFSTSIGGATDTVSGHVDFLNGTITWSSASGVVDSVNYQAVCSLEENKINPTVKYDIEKIRLTVIDRRISTEWSHNMEQDVKALFDLSLQNELVSIMGEQLALDIDSDIIADLLAANASLNAVSHTVTFDKNPPEDFYWGRKQWYENIQPVLSEVSALVYNDTLMGAANTIACNPLDAAIFESFNDYRLNGHATEGGEVGYSSASVAGGKWKILSSNIVPAGKMIVKYRSNDLSRAAFVYAPYVPALLTPYPLGANPSMTVMTRYAKKVIRHKAIAQINITDTALT